ncbi:PREP [Cordylochernes scorpioides]|uniref:Prolyl endopeptidase n=1 Tax=Cordylochernes scorpioides TaxID=51811 RepID=A0ABY6JYE8_9ARAC|nr:PREP [Cordylochernes scorpioides]
MFNYPKVDRDTKYSENFHGIQIPDPYHWLEDLESNDTKRFIEDQNTLFRSYIENVKERESIRQKLRELWNYPKFGCPLRRGDRYFYSYNSGLQTQNVIYMLEKLNGQPKVCLDPNNFSTDGSILLKVSSVSEDGRYYCYGLGFENSDWITLKIKDLNLSADIPDVLNKVKFTNISWTYDFRGFFYEGFPYFDPTLPLEHAANSRSNQQVIMYHHIGTSQEQDIHCVEFENQITWFIGSEISDNGEYLFISVYKDSKTNNMYYIDVPALEPISANMAVKEIITTFDSKFEYISNRQSTVTFRTNRNAKMYKLVNIDLNTPEESKWLDLIPETEHYLEWALCVNGDKLVVCYIEHVKNVLYLYNKITGKKYQRLSLGVGTISRYSGHKMYDNFFLHFHSFLKPGIIFQCEISKENIQLEAYRTIKIQGFDENDYKIKQVFYNSLENVKIPMYLIFKKNLVKKSSNPCLLFAYGGFNNCLMPSFSAARAFFIRNFDGIAAIANVRGGGEYGTDWHRDGILANKINSIRDLQSAATFLIWNSFTSYKRLIVHGVANGGMIAAASLNQSPEKFGCALIHMGILDLLKFDRFTIGQSWIGDYGDPANERDFSNIIKYSPLHNIGCEYNRHVQYPGVLVLTSEKDNKVVPSHSFKYIAELQYNVGEMCEQKCPLLIRIDSKTVGPFKHSHKLLEEYVDIFLLPRPYTVETQDEFVPRGSTAVLRCLVPRVLRGLVTVEGWRVAGQSRDLDMERDGGAIQLSNELSSATGTRISRQTVYRRLHEGALYARRPMVCIPLSSAHRRARLNWCLEHHAWTHDQWANVLFSDESRFSLNTDYRRVFIWREPGTRYHPSNIREIDSFRGGSLLVWAGISSSRRTPLHIFSGGTLTAQRSPDLNPIEHVWDALGRRIGAGHPSPRTLVELRTALLEEWGLLPLDLLQSLVNSMRARCETLIAVRGDHTPY